MTSLPIFVINLDRRPDRLASLAARFKMRGLAFERLRAIDGADPDFAERGEGFARKGPVGTIHDGALACSLSHAEAWGALIESGREAAVIAEDDIDISPRFPEFLDAFAAARLNIDLVKLERRSNERGLFVEKSGYELAGCELRRLHSLHASAAAYIISRNGAEKALAHFPFINVPMDHFLFNPGRGTAFNDLKPYQLFPALAGQSREAGGASDIGVRKKRGNIVTGARRAGYHLRRTAFEAGPFFGALAGLCAGRLTLRRAI